VEVASVINGEIRGPKATKAPIDLATMKAPRVELDCGHKGCTQRTTAGPFCKEHAPLYQCKAHADGRSVKKCFKIAGKSSQYCAEHR